MLIMLVLIACDSNDPTTSTDDPAQQTIQVQGALNAHFEQAKTEFFGALNSASLSSGGRLDLRVLARERDGDVEKQVNLVITLPLAAGERMLPPDDYLFTAEELQARVDYYLSNRERQAYAQYQFEGRRLNLRITKADLNGVHGQFSLQARQSQGRRMLDGQREDVQLADEGQIQVQSRFEITEISMH
ncbi:MAG TPA: hypothetical protein VKP65_25915 [Rhodothermales bacterium]|nr:hypothetical protein [Rhodothermales bacterium]